MSVEDDRAAAARAVAGRLRAADLSNDVKIVLISWGQGDRTTVRKVSLYPLRPLDDGVRSRVAQALEGIRISYQERPGSRRD